MTQSTSLEQSVREQLERYFSDLGESNPRNMLSMVVSSVEKTVIEVVLEKTQGNQTQAAEMLGITRNTLRRKRTTYNL